MITARDFNAKSKKWHSSRPFTWIWYRKNRRELMLAPFRPDFMKKWNIIIATESPSHEIRSWVILDLKAKAIVVYLVQFHTGNRISLLKADKVGFKKFDEGWLKANFIALVWGMNYSLRGTQKTTEELIQSVSFTFIYHTAFSSVKSKKNCIWTTEIV